MKIAFLFPGHGSQFVGMGKQLYDDSRLMQEYFDQASHCVDKNFVKLCFASSDTELGRMENAYVALFATSCALFSLVKDLGITPDCVAGYNIGEYAAMFAAGGLNFPDGLYLLSKYASFYEKELENLKADAVRIKGIDVEQVEQWCAKASTKTKPVSIAVYDTHSQCVIAGNADAVLKVREKALDDNAKVDDVGVEVGLHSELMQPVADQFKVYLAKVDFHDTQVPVISNSAKQVSKGAALRDEVTQRLVEPVLWHKAMRKLKSYDLIVEIGPGTFLSELVKSVYPDKLVIAVNKQEDVDRLKEIVGIEPQAEI